MWRNTLHQIDKISKNDKNALIYVSEQLEKSGPLGSRELIRRGVESLHKSVSPKNFQN